jgi:hypothetical protein
MVGEEAPGVPQVGPPGDALELPVHAHEGAEIGLVPLFPLLLEHAYVPGGGVDAELPREDEGTIAQLGRSGVEWRHVAFAIGTGAGPDEMVHPDGVPADCPACDRRR